MMYGTRITDNNGMRLHNAIHQCSRSNQHIVTDNNLSHHGCIDADTYSITNCRDTASLTTRFHSNRHSFMQMTVFAYYRITVDSIYA